MKTRIQVTINPDLIALAKQLMDAEHHTNFSAWVEQLIRDEARRHQPDNNSQTRHQQQQSSTPPAAPNKKRKPARK